MIEAVYFYLEVPSDDGSARTGALIAWINRQGQSQNRGGIGNGRPRPPKLRTVDLRVGEVVTPARLLGLLGVLAAGEASPLLVVLADVGLGVAQHLPQHLDLEWERRRHGDGTVLKTTETRILATP